MRTVLFVDTEIEAELARGALESASIPAQVRFTAKAGYPRYAVGYGGMGMGAPLSAYEVQVPQEKEEEARRVVGTLDAPRHRPGAWRVWLVRAFTLVVLAAFFFSAVLQLRVLF